MDRFLFAKSVFQSLLRRKLSVALREGSVSAAIRVAGFGKYKFYVDVFVDHARKTLLIKYCDKYLPLLTVKDSALPMTWIAIRLNIVGLL